MVVARVREGGELRNPVGNAERDPRRSRMIEVYESRQDGVGKTTYGMETNFERKFKHREPDHSEDNSGEPPDERSP